MDNSQIQQKQSFQNAVATVEALSLEELTLLMQIMQEKLQQKQKTYLNSNIKNSQGFKAYLASKQKRFEVYKNLAES